MGMLINIKHLNLRHGLFYLCIIVLGGSIGTAQANDEAQAAISAFREARVEAERKARVRSEGFKTSNNKHGVEAKKYLAEAVAFGERANPIQQELSAIFAEAKALNEKSSALEKQAEAIQSGSEKINLALDSQELKNRCQASQGKQIISIAGGRDEGRGLASDSSQILNSGSFQVDTSRDVKDSFSGGNNLGSASRIPSKAGK
jgi:hypothetical protein